MRYFLVVTALILLIAACDQKEKPDEDNGLSLSKAMGEIEDENFDKVIDKREFVFPEDHGPHPGFRTEWWYLTGNISTESGRMFGYQFTIFRTALTAVDTIKDSDWRSNQIYMGHFALSDIQNEDFYFDEKFNRGANDLAGAKAVPLKVWLEDWQIKQSEDEIFFKLPPLTLEAKNKEVSISFELEAIKPMVLQGDEGLSQKGKNPGNASYYYSYTRLKTNGTIKIDDDVFNVTGFSWMDREWSTSALDENQVGWDWFALQLDDDSEIMYYQMRKSDGKPDEFSKGTIVDEKGNSELIKKDEVNLTVLNYWKSPNDSEYPSGWQLEIPGKKIKLQITPAFKEQFMDVSVKYWEGAVSISGEKEGQPISGSGYVELTGY